MNKSPAFQMYASDYFMDTNSWTVDEVGIYQRLLLTQWANGGLPDNEKRLARIAGCGIKKFQKGWTTIKIKFQQNGNGNLINLRLEEERQKQLNYRELQSQKGKLSASKRSTVVETVVEPELQPKVNSSVFSLQSSSSLNNIINKEQAKAPFILPSKEEINEGSDPMLLELIDTVSFQLYNDNIFPEVNAFKNKMLKKKINPRSILHTLCRAYLKKEFEEGPWPYCQKIIEIESRKYNARDYGKTL
jgi:uncharacterized protein YdaU (DUF1376 family)